MRRFALTHHYHSAKAYSYMREKFSLRLPAPSTMRKWYAKSNSNGASGICKGTMLALSNLVHKMEESGRMLNCSLAFDETCIKRHVQWLHGEKKFSGFITYGRKEPGENLPLASQAIVFLITCVELKISLPVAHYFITSLKAEEKVVLLIEIIRNLIKLKVNTLNITFDGLASNRSMCEMLGASFDPDNLNPNIEIDGKKILIFPDPCHMLKLVRNSLAKHRQFIIDGKLISWRYFERLENLREKNNFISHKLTKEHMQWDRNQMKVCLAAQVFSKSVFRSMNYLRTENNILFKHSEATANFALIINNIFDIFNSKHIDSTSEFRRGLSRNADEILNFLDFADNYFRFLKLGRIRVVDSRIKFGFIGFLMNIQALKILYQEYVLTNKISVILTFYLSQDLLENFFGHIRSKLGHNDNPTVQQFCAAFRVLTIENEISSKEFANCQDSLNILTIPSTSRVSTSVSNDQRTELSHIIVDNEKEEEDKTDLIPTDLYDMSMHEIGTVYFFARKIEEKVLKSRFECNECKNIFEENEKLENNSNMNDCWSICKSTIYICEQVHKLFCVHSQKLDFDYELLLAEIKKEIPFQEMFVATDFSHDIYHKSYFIDFIIDEYVRFYGTYMTKHMTLSFQNSLIRRKLHKIIHYKNL